MSHLPNPFSDHPPPNPYAAPQAPGGQFAPPPGTLPFAPCPQCGNSFASKIGFTWWGGVVGPAILNHVKCCRCGSAYNGKTGKSNAVGIAIYIAIGTVIGIAILAVLFLGQLL